LHTYLQSAPRAADLIVPVPLHPNRERERGYNQSALLAKELSRLTGIPLATDLLRRTIDTAPQVSMDDYEQRRRNIEGAFECIGDLSGMKVLLKVLLVDDVITTGSTMSACAAPLKSKGAARVWGLALAR
jgi:ComF family protein